MNVTTIGMDIAKNVFQVHGVDADEQVVIRRQLRRSQVISFFRKLPPCLVGMEACATSHYWARELRKLGHEVGLMPPVYVKPYVKRNKNDAADAAAICEAVTRPSMRFVAIKSALLQKSWRGSVSPCIRHSRNPYRDWLGQVHHSVENVDANRNFHRLRVVTKGMQPIANDGFVATHRRLDQAALTIVMRLLPSDTTLGCKLENVTISIGLFLVIPAR